MTKLDENLSLSFDQQLRNQLINNFHLLNSMIDFEDQETLERKIDEYCKKYMTEFDEELHKEIRAIILPDASPLQITQEVLDFRTDSSGAKQTSMARRLMAEIQYLKSKYFDSSDIWKAPISIDDAGRITTNYLEISAIKKAKRIGIIGDSVARGYKAAYNFGDLFKKVSDAEVTNVAVNGARMTDNNENSLFQQSKKISNCDVVIIQGTDDDWLGDVPIGTKYDDEKSSYLGAFYKVVQNIQLLNPNTKLLIMTATLQTPMDGTTIRRTDRLKNKLGKDLHDYMNAQKLACNDLNLPFADFMSEVFFQPSNPAFRKKMMSEGLHPNEVGHQMIAQELAKQIYYFYG